MRESPFVRNGKTLLSGIDPVRRAERTADAVSVRDRTLYFCPSPLYGYGLKRLLERLEAEAPNSAILCVEADPELYELSVKSIVSSFAADKKLHVTNISDIESLCALVRETWGVRAFRRVETIRFSGGWQLFPQLYDSLCEQLQREIATDWSNALTLTKLGRLYIRNALRNISLIPDFPSITDMSFGSSPILVLGAGPSLDETLDALESRFLENIRAVKRPFRIICVDTCLGALKDRNITPDLVVILESQYWNILDFIGCRGWEIPVAADLSALPSSVRILVGGGYLFMTPWTQLRIFERLKEAVLLPAVIPPLGSVGLAAVELARRLGSGKIICAGLDFSFSIDKFHARGTPGHRGRLNAQTRLKSIISHNYDASFAAVSKSGLPLRSNPSLQNYRDLFEREFSCDSRLFDIAGNGLPLGLKTLSMEDAIEMISGGSAEATEGRILNTEFCSPNGQPGATRSEERELLKEKVLTFFYSEKKRLVELRNILTGEAAQQGRLNVLIDECDYLWAHFPDYSGGRRSPLEEIASRNDNALSFLKRLRAEIDPMLALIERQI
jgi:hypothetical protein